MSTERREEAKNLLLNGFDSFISSYISACIDYKQQKNQCYGNFKILRELCIKNYFYIYNLFKSDCEKNKINNMNISEAYSHYIINNKVVFLYDFIIVISIVYIFIYTYFFIFLINYSIF